MVHGKGGLEQAGAGKACPSCKAPVTAAPTCQNCAEAQGRHGLLGKLSVLLAALVLLTACTGESPQASTSISNNDASASDKFQITEVDSGIYQFTSADLSRESSVDLVLQIIIEEHPDLIPILMVYDNYYKENFYGYILGQSEIGSQIITAKITCAEENDQYCLVRIYQDIIDDLSSREGHQATTEEFAVLKSQNVIVRGAALNADFDTAIT